MLLEHILFGHGIKQTKPVDFAAAFKPIIQVPGSANELPDHVKSLISTLTARRKKVVNQWDGPPYTDPLTSRDTLSAGPWRDYIAVLHGLLTQANAGTGTSTSAPPSTSTTDPDSNQTKEQGDKDKNGDKDDEGKDNANSSESAKPDSSDAPTTAAGDAQAKEGSSPPTATSSPTDTKSKKPDSKSFKNTTKVDSALSSYISPAGRLSGCVPFYWTNLLGKERATSAWSAHFELANLLLGEVIWLKLRVNAIAMQKDAADRIEDVEREVYNTLLDAAGILAVISEVVLPSMPAEVARSMPYDLHPNVIKAMIEQTIAEAQGTTIARAIRKGNSPALIARLARDSEKRYVTAMSLSQFVAAKELDATKMGQAWQEYLLFKASFYQALCYAHWGIHLNTADPANLSETRGPGIRCIQHALSTLETVTLPSAKNYVKTQRKTNRASQPGTDVLVKLVEDQKKIYANHLRNFERKNAIVAYSTIPTDPPEPPEPQTLVNHKKFEWPQDTGMWDGGVYECFNPSLLRSGPREGQGGGGPPRQRKSSCAVM